MLVRTYKHSTNINALMKMSVLVPKAPPLTVEPPANVWNRQHSFMTHDCSASSSTEENCDSCLLKDKQLNKLSHTLIQTQHELRDLKLHIQELSDLNLISPYATKFYTLVFKQVKQNFQRQNKDRFVSLPYNSWVELFSAASTEATMFDDFDTDKKPINNMILAAMSQMCDFTLTDWEEIQSIRKDRNSKGHPRLDDSKVVDAIGLRWTEHSAYASLTKMMKFLQKKKQQQQPRQKPAKKMWRSDNKRTPS